MENTFFKKLTKIKFSSLTFTNFILTFSNITFTSILSYHDFKPFFSYVKFNLLIYFVLSFLIYYNLHYQFWSLRFFTYSSASIENLFYFWYELTLQNPLSTKSKIDIVKLWEEADTSTLILKSVDFRWSQYS